MKILRITNCYPTKDNNLRGIFVKNRVIALKRYHNIESIVVSTPYEISGIFITPYKYLVFFLKILKSTLFDKFDIVHCHDPMCAGVLGLIPTLLRGKRMVITLHGPAAKVCMKNQLLTWITSLAVKRANKLIPVSLELKNFLSKTFKVPDNKMVVITTSQFLEDFYVMDKKKARKKFGLPLDKKIFFHLSFLFKRKKVPMLVEAFSQIPNRDAFLVIGGQGEDSERVANLVKQLKLEDKVKMVGPISRKNVPLYMNAADIFVLPTTGEGTPGVLMEALACGLPIIASRVGGIPSMLNSEKIGLMIEPSNLEDLKGKMKMFLDGKTNFSQKEILKKSKNYSIKVNSTRIKKVYEEILK